MNHLFKKYGIFALVLAMSSPVFAARKLGDVEIKDLTVTGASTGVTAASAAPDWVTATAYGLDEVIVDPNSGVLYRAASAHTSTGTNLTDDVGKYEVIGSASNGVIVTPWVSFVMGSTNITFSSTSMQWRRVGENVEILGSVVIAAVPASEARFHLPNGLTIDFSAGGSGNRLIVGEYTRDFTDSNVRFPVLALTGQNYMTVGPHTQVGSANPLAPSDANTIGGGGEPNNFHAIVPVLQYKNSGTTVSLFDLTEETKWVDEGVVSVSWPNLQTIGNTTRFKATKDSNGIYTLHVKIAGITSVGTTVNVVTLGSGFGTTFKADSDGTDHPMSQGAITGGRAIAKDGFATIEQHTTSSTQLISIAGSAELVGKPDFFDANRENPSSISAFVTLNDEPTLNAVYMTATTTPGAPVPGSGVFYSDILGRAPMLDPSKIPSGKHGVERIANLHLGSISRSEYGPSGEQVIEGVDDRVRFIGNGWGTALGLQGQNRTNFTAGSSIEVSFYGTGLNLLWRHHDGANNITINVDGGAESACKWCVAGSGVLSSRSYNANSVLPLASGLSLGIHTVTINFKDTIADFMSGLEILNDATTVAIPSGSIVYKGKQFITPATTDDLTTFENEFQDGAASGVKTVGGHQVRYFDIDGTIKKDINYADSTQLDLGAADHSNEESVQKFSWEEFGVNRVDDFSTVAGPTTTRAFTLDDGSTTLVGRVNSVSDPMLIPSTGYVILTFVGTGLDIVRADLGSSADNHNISIDGSIIGTTTPGTTGIQPIVSGLPFGTHVMRIDRTAATSSDVGITDFIVYAPKKPVLSGGQVEIDSTYKVADFVANATIGTDTIGTGIIRKTNMREMTYIGSWTPAGPDGVNTLTGFGLGSFSNGGSWSYSFFGTGFDARAQYSTNGSVSMLMEIDDGSGYQAVTAANFPTITQAFYGVNSFSTATGVVDGDLGSQANGTGVVVSGLPLGRYTARLTNQTADQIRFGAFDIITPTYSYKNNLLNLDEAMVGSNSLKNEVLIPGATKHKIIATAGIETTSLDQGKPVVINYGVLTAQVLVSGTTIVNYDKRIIDTCSCVVTGVGKWRFIAPRDGYYSVSAVASFNPIDTPADTNLMYIVLQKNGSLYNSTGIRSAGWGFASSHPTTTASEVMELKAGDYVDSTIIYNLNGSRQLDNNTGLTNIQIHEIR